MIDRFLGDAFRVLSCPFRSTVLQYVADTYRKLLDRAVSGARFLIWGVFECSIAYHLSGAVRCMLQSVEDQV